MASNSSGHYDRVAVALHWIIGLWLLGQVAFGWLLDEFPRGTPEKAMAVNLHKSSGLVLLLLILLRVLWRLRHAPPAYPAAVTARQIRAIRIGHGLLYLCMLALPITGYIASNFSKYGVNFFNVWPIAPWGPEDKALYGLFNESHDALGLAFTLLILGHIGLAAYHAYIARDGLAARIRPAPTR